MILNNEGLNNGFAAFWQRKEAWIIRSYIMALIYILWVIFNFFTKSREFEASENISIKAMIYLFVTAFAIRIVPAMIVFGPVSDMGVFQKSQYLTNVMHDWKSPFAIMPYYYFQVYILDFAAKISNLMHIAPYFVIKLPVIAADSFLAVFVLLLSQDKNKGYLYAWNPVTILISSYHGMFDAETLLFILVFLWLLKKNAPLFWCGIIFGLAFQSKIWPIILLPVLLSGQSIKKIMNFIFGWAIVFILFSFPDIMNKGYYLKPLVYGSLDGWWGISGLLWVMNNKIVHSSSAYDFSIVFLKAIFFAALIYSYYILRKSKMNNAILSILLTFYVFTPGWGIQYLLWIVPFLIITGKFNRRITSAILVYMIFAYFFYLLYHIERGAGITNDSIRFLTIIFSLPAYAAFVYTLL